MTITKGQIYNMNGKQVAIDFTNGVVAKCRWLLTGDISILYIDAIKIAIHNGTIKLVR